MNRQNTTTLVMIADAGGATLYLHARPGAALTLHSAVDAPTTSHRHTHELGRDKPPRTYESVGTTRHAQEPRSDLHRKAKTTFAAELAREIDEAIQDEMCSALVLVAPAQMMGDLRSHLSHRVRVLVTGEVVKDLRHRPLDQIRETLRTELGIRVQD